MFLSASRQGATLSGAPTSASPEALASPAAPRAPAPSRFTPGFRATFADTARAYCASTARPADTLSRLLFWIDFLADTPLVDVTADQVDEGLAALAARGRLRPMRGGPAVATGKPLSEATLTRYAADVGGVYKFARRQRLTSRAFVPPTKGLEVAQSPLKSTFIDAGDKDKLVAVARVLDRRWGRMCALIETAFSSGWRAGNLGALRWADVDLDAGVIRAATTKNGEPVYTPISSAAVAELRRLPGKVADALVFANKAGTAGFQYRKLWLRITHEAGLDGHNFHLLRHGCGSTLAAAGAGQAQIMAHMGHRSLAASRRYMHANVEAKRELAARVFG